MLLLFIASTVNTLLLISINLMLCCSKSSVRAREHARPRPLPPPPPHIELAGSGTKEDHTLRDVASLTRDDDSSKKTRKKTAEYGSRRQILL
ncbi:hypothetical protein GCK32_000940 [Trichostrongylus colubriformis]|uniref:Secreted protein n=1 Tax=Trichostrongylus colubriformis TaxID=6319 RepID=A0AAN8G3X2_TRICO